ncbi:trafficking protein particle complex subunit 13-like [Varroa destructor]|uniref:Trafficking protein particle complex subunit 13 n=1 Tax=Varroa destructor TaxID=109461 RepID=A0A7M7JC32_VARDE|nr:trafficking protein particle complex subunit 13-like [Varroa destructor]XP_022649870.1 trafficking protein particle complex subunit 13-like [Varroa destructor]XP_022649871.1 trafficking protein particle complex subunit 13-like [Varroa destructor]
MEMNNVVLKVMRLARPSFTPNTRTPMCEPWDFDILPSDHSGPQVFSSDMLYLPQSFGSIYLGETFSSYMTVHNGSSMDVGGVQLKAELHNGNHKVCLNPVIARGGEVLKPNESLDQIIQHEVKEIGTHLLQCIVSYINATTGEPMQFCKYFKFQVYKPLDVKTKFYNSETGETFIEAQLQNITSNPVTLAKVSLEPSPQFQVTALNQNDTGDSVFGEVNLINPQDSRQYLFSCRPKSRSPQEGKKSARGSSAIGKLDIIWKSALGEKGRLQTSQLERTLFQHSDISLIIEQFPSKIELETSFTITFTIMNTSERAIDLTVSLENQEGLMWVDSTGYELPQIPAHKSIIKDFSLFMTRCGLQSIGGIKLTENCFKQTYKFDHIGQLIVIPSV